MTEDSRADGNTVPISKIYETGLVLHCVCAIVRLGVPDCLADNGLDLSDLATAVGAQAEPLWRVLRFLAAQGIFTLNGRLISLTDTGRLLCRNHPQSMWPAFAAVGPADAAHALTHTLRTGDPAVEKALGTSFWGYLAANPQEQEKFDALMFRQARDLVAPCIANLEWPDSGTVADIGGGVGALLAAVLRESPCLRGVLVEQPQVIARARTFLAELRVIGRCDLHQGSLFTPPPQADIYLLAFVLHDWSDREALQILGAIREGAAASSRLRVIERFISDDDSPQLTKMFDIGMLLLTNGRERTESELELLLRRARWKVEKIFSHHDSINVVQAQAF